jgi:rhamnose utilization protein RhaD (predicted bifunctional aldolase and dehydrogenase)/NAD(P)-dependent dehydrogenase (short-subunit alcohol dehydrogenase family)
MQSLWCQQQASQHSATDLDLRIYTSRLFGMDDNLVMHGGGNTSVKIAERNIFGEEQAIVYVKGSGVDLKTIDSKGFVPVELTHLLKLAELDTLSDIDMVREMACAKTVPNAPSPSIETILHAVIPSKFVDHTHADTVVTISNTPGGAQKLQQIYGDRVLILPYVKPGFMLAKQINDALKAIDLSQFDGIVLLHHGIFTFNDNAQTSYEMMIKLVTLAEDYIKNQAAWEIEQSDASVEFNALDIAKMRKRLSQIHGSPVVIRWHHDPASVTFSSLDNIETVATQGPITPDHVIQTKRIAMVINDDIDAAIDKFEADYRQYFSDNAGREHTLLDCAPRIAVAKNKGIFAIAANAKRLNVVNDIYQHTMKAIQWAEKLGGWTTLPPQAIFEMEYWSLEQAKLNHAKAKSQFEGKIAFVTGAASGIGKATARDLLDRGACVVATDISAKVCDMFDDEGFLGLVCDVSSAESVKTAVTRTVQYFGGIDIVVSNAGIFPASALVEDLDEDTWDQSLNINLSGHYRLIKFATPYLKQAIDPSIVILASKNVLAPGPGAAAYSCAKAGLTQLARVSALELAPFGIRVNVLHPNAVFDTDLWTDDVITARAANYGISIEQYKKSNLLHTEITSKNVAELVAQLSSSAFAKTTGAQIPIDGGNERVI